MKKYQTMLIAFTLVLSKGLMADPGGGGGAGGAGGSGPEPDQWALLAVMSIALLSMAWVRNRNQVKHDRTSK
jgi:hypothetical protein